LFSAVDPRTGTAIGTYREASAEDVRRAAAAASEASGSVALADRSRRAALLEVVAGALRERCEEIVSCADAETALGEARLQGELERTAVQLQKFSEIVEAGDYLEALIDLPDPEAKPTPRPDLRRMLVPIGPVAVFGASNFPLAFSVAGGDTASALAAGCPVIVKGHPSHPGTSKLVAETLRGAVSDCGLPDGSFALLQSSSAVVGEDLVERPEVAAVAFTGSLRAGRALFERASRRSCPIPVYAEMGSVNPFVVSRGALATRGEQIAEGLISSVTGSAGQLCTKPGLVFIPAGASGQAFADALGRSLGDGAPQWLLSEQIRDGLTACTAMLQALTEPIGEASSPNAPEDVSFCAQPQLFLTSAARLRERPEIAQECFGPVAVLAIYEHLEELCATLPRLGGQLTATVHSEPCEADAIRPLVSVLARIAGRLVFDGYPTGVSVTHAMQHGGPYPASTAAAYTSVGMAAIERFLRPLAWQNAPARLLPPELHDENPVRIAQRIDPPGRVRRWAA
jgi:NADP-dependent aldehyde dehydrogenase